MFIIFPIDNKEFILDGLVVVWAEALFVVDDEPLLLFCSNEGDRVGEAGAGAVPYTRELAEPTVISLDNI